MLFEVLGQRVDQREQARRARLLASGRPVEAEHRLGLAAPRERERGELARLVGIGRLDADALARRGEPDEVRLELERHAAVDAHRLERGAAAEHRLVVRVDGRLVRVDEAASLDGERREPSRDGPARRAADVP